jgi:hypothetical protein
MQQPLVKSSDFDQKAGAIQGLLRSPDGARHIRVIDEAGGGKTRFVLEATNTDDLAPLVLYTRAINFIDSDFKYLILRDDNPFNVILVLDECNQQQRIQIWNHLANRGPRIKLITINNEPDSKDHGIDYCDIPALQHEDIKKIILTYGIPQDHVDRWASLAGTSPRFAHMIAINLKYFPDDILRPVEGIYDRIIAGYEDPTSEEVKKRKRVITHIALFKRFGYKKPVEEEAKAVCRLVQRVDTNITWGKFQEIVDRLLSQNILQGETTLYITPKAFHIRMWIEWWNIYGSSFDLNEFLADIPEGLQAREWFYEMFEYAAESGAAAKVVKELLGPGGPFKDFEYFKTKLGGRFFLALTNADPESGLGSLQRTIGKQTKDQLLAFTVGRRDVVWSLERIAVWRSLFADAARLLLALAEAENEIYANNATGVFTGLFSPGPGKVAPTEASPQERIVVLKEALNSPSKQKRLVGIKAADNALETGNFTRMVGAEYQGLRKEPNLWMPKTYAELFDAYSQVWHLLAQKLETLKPDERSEVINVLLNNSRGLLLYHSLADMVIATLVELSHKDYVDKKKILSAVIETLHYDGKALNESTRKALEQFRDTFTGSGFSAMMRRYVGMDLLQDQFDEEGEHADKIGPRIEELAEQAVKDKRLLLQEFPWLVTTEAQNGYRFGYALGKRDVGFTLLPLLLDAQRGASVNPSVYSLGGYFRAIFEKDNNMWEDQLDALVKDGKLNSFLPELTWRSGMTDRAAMRLLRLAQQGTIAFRHFSLLGIGSVIRDLSPNVFEQLCSFLLEHDDYAAISIALDLHFFYYIHNPSKPPLPEGLTLRLLTHKSLFKNPEKGRRGQMDEFHWTGIGKAFVQAYPEKALLLADTILEHFGEDGTILEGFFSETQPVLNEIIKKYPAEMWQKIKPYLTSHIDRRAYSITEWLKGGEHFKEKQGVLPLLPDNMVWDWVNEDIENRAWYLAYFVPKELTREEGKKCWARELLIRYGEREDVRRNLVANFSSESWTGPQTLHYESKKQWLLQFKKDEPDENVKRWIDEYVASIDRQIEHAKIAEERDDF